MSEDITNIRKNIRQILRRANSMGSEANKDGTLKEYHEHRRKFLTYRNKFEKAEHEAKEKKPFIPDWVKSGQSQPLPIIYKLKGSEVTDIRTDLTQDEQTFGIAPKSIHRSSSFAATSGHERERDYIRQLSKENFSYLKGLYEKNQTEGSSTQVRSTLDVHSHAVRSTGSQQQPKSVSRFKSLRRSSNVSPPPESPTYETASWSVEKNESTEVTTVITNMRNKFLQSLWEDNDQREQDGNPGYYSLPANYAESMRAARKNNRVPKSQIPDLIIDPIKWDHMKVRDNRFSMAELSTTEFHLSQPRTPEPQETPQHFTVKVRSPDEAAASNYVSWDHGARVNEIADVGEDTVDEENVETLPKEDITVFKMQETNPATLDQLCERLSKDMAVPDGSETSTDQLVRGESSRAKESRQQVSQNALITDKKQTEFKSKIPLRIPALLKTKFSSKKTRPMSEPSNSAVSKSKVVNQSGRKNRSSVNSIVKEPVGLDKSILVQDSTIQKTTKISKHNGNKTPVKTTASTRN